MPTRQLNRFCQRSVMLALLGLESIATCATAKSIMPCEAPLFADASVNVIILPFEYAGSDADEQYIKWGTSEAARDLTWALAQDTILSARYEGLGVVAVPPKQLAEGEGCTEDAVASWLEKQTGEYTNAPRPGQAFILLSGLIYQEAGELFLQTKLRSLRAGATRGLAPSNTDALEFNFRDPQGIVHQVSAVVGTDDIVFPPHRVTTSDLTQIASHFREASHVHDDAHAINQNINKFTIMRRIGGKAFDRKRGFSPDVFAGCA